MSARHARKWMEEYPRRNLSNDDDDDTQLIDGSSMLLEPLKKGNKKNRIKKTKQNNNNIVRLIVKAIVSVSLCVCARHGDENLLTFISFWLPTYPTSLLT